MYEYFVVEKCWVWRFPQDSTRGEFRAVTDVAWYKAMSERDHFYDGEALTFDQLPEWAKEEVPSNGG